MAKLEISYKDSVIKQVEIETDDRFDGELQTRGKFLEDSIGISIKSSLPEELQEVKYIRGTGEQWIDTGFIANGGVIMEAKAACKYTNGDFSLCIGSIGPSSINPNLTRNMIGIDRGSANFQKGSVFCKGGFNIGYEDPQIFWMNTVGTNFEATMNGLTILVNPNNVKETLSNLTTTVKLYKADYDGSIALFDTYYFKMWDSTLTLVRAMKPCYRKSDFKTGMYDLVTQSFFPNQGSSEFVLGPNIG